MSLRTGSRLFLPRPKGRSEDFQVFLTKVRNRFRGWHIAMLLDEDASHTAKASQLAAEGITLLWLPKRSPELNPMDTLWGQAKDVVSVIQQYESIDRHVDQFLQYLNGLTNSVALSTSGVRSERFWLQHVL